MTINGARKQIYKKSLIVLICLLMFGNLAHGVVLCFGSEGHISIEIKSADCCDEFPGIPIQASAYPYGNSSYSESEDPCGDCIDIPLPGSCITKRPTSFVTKKSSPLEILPATIISALANNSVSTNKECVKFVNHLNDTLTSIRTTVLIV